jgi:hypothetical protein
VTPPLHTETNPCIGHCAGRADSACVTCDHWNTYRMDLKRAIETAANENWRQLARCGWMGLLQRRHVVTGQGPGPAHPPLRPDLTATETWQPLHCNAPTDLSTSTSMANGQVCARNFLARLQADWLSLSESRNQKSCVSECQSGKPEKTRNRARGMGSDGACTC